MPVVFLLLDNSNAPLLSDSYLMAINMAVLVNDIVTNDRPLSHSISM